MLPGEETNRTTDPPRPRALARLTGLLVLVGVLVGVAAVPVGTVLAIGAQWAGRQPGELPPQLLNPPAAQVTRVYADDGRTLLTTFYDEDRHDVALAQIAPSMRQAIVAAEDVRFFRHGGVDLKGAVRALVADLRSGAAGQGASTLTMQLVRNVLKEDPSLTPAQRAAATADTPARKLREMEYAEELDQRLTKPQILQNYLNIVYFGDGAYGIEAAARRIFGIAPAGLDLAQSALIAGIVQSPDADNPIGGDRGRARERQLYVLSAMAKAGMITPARRAAAAAERLTYAGQNQPTGCADAAGRADGWGFFCDYVQRWWDAQPQFGATVRQRETALHRGGYTVVTTLDPAIQQAAAAESRSVYRLSSRKVLPIAVVEPGSGRVRALAVNRRYGTSGTGATVNPLISGGGGGYGYPSGSTFKLFTMLAALQSGRPLSTSFDAPPKLPTKWPGTGPDSCGGRYCPRNDNPSWMDGRRTMWDAFGRSVNTYFVHLEERVGPAAAVAEAKKLGISFAAPADARMARTSADSWGAFTLGVVDVTPLELASAYATIAAEGTYCTPLPVESISGPGGERVALPTDCRQVLPAGIARAATDAARCPVGEQSTYHKCDGGTAQQVAGIFGGRPVAGKTGSTENNTTETFVGFTRTMAAAGIAADPADPSDRVGRAVESRVVTAVARTLRVAVGSDAYPDFVPPGPSVALGR